jgi:hypothetical protein
MSIGLATEMELPSQRRRSTCQVYWPEEDGWRGATNREWNGAGRLAPARGANAYPRLAVTLSCGQAPTTTCTRRVNVEDRRSGDHPRYSPGTSAEALYDIGSFLSQPLAEDHVRQGDIVILNEQGLSSTISSSARSKVTSAALDGQFVGRVPAKTKKKCCRPS